MRFEHEALRTLRHLDGRRWLVGVSGGVDSMALAEVLTRWRRGLKRELIFAHVHHGAGVAYRDDAQDFVRRWARARKLPFVTNVNEPAGPEDEASLRDRRFRAFARWRAKYACDHLVLAHHRDDLLETRLLRLVRGTGPNGLRGFGRRDGVIARPFASLARADVEAYARARGLEWLEDPSNVETARSLRNWVRREWLPALEARAAGGTNALARSLGLLVDARPSVRLGLVAGVRRAAWRALDVGQREAVAAEFLRSAGAVDPGLGHARELTKRLESKRSVFHFHLAGLVIHVDRDLWWASRV